MKFEDKKKIECLKVHIPWEKIYSSTIHENNVGDDFEKEKRRQQEIPLLNLPFKSIYDIN
jgi:hypothetical protein